MASTWQDVHLVDNNLLSQAKLAQDMTYSAGNVSCPSTYWTSHHEALKSHTPGGIMEIVKSLN